MIIKAIWIAADDNKLENGMWHKWLSEKYVFIKQQSCRFLLKMQIILQKL